MLWLEIGHRSLNIIFARQFTAHQVEVPGHVQTRLHDSRALSFCGHRDVCAHVKDISNETIATHVLIVVFLTTHVLVVNNFLFTSRDS